MKQYHCFFRGARKNFIKGKFLHHVKERRLAVHMFNVNHVAP